MVYFCALFWLTNLPDFRHSANAARARGRPNPRSGARPSLQVACRSCARGRPAHAIHSTPTEHRPGHLRRPRSRRPLSDRQRPHPHAAPRPTRPQRVALPWLQRCQPGVLAKPRGGPDGPMAGAPRHTQRLRFARSGCKGRHATMARPGCSAAATAAAKRRLPHRPLREMAFGGERRCPRTAAASVRLRRLQRIQRPAQHGGSRCE